MYAPRRERLVCRCVCSRVVTVDLYSALSRLNSKVLLGMACVDKGSQFYFTCTRLSTWNEPYLLLLPSRRASPHWLVLISRPLRVGGGVGLQLSLCLCVVCTCRCNSAV